MSLTFQELFEDSATMYPDGGYLMSPAACGFILAEMDGMVEKYRTELKDESLSPQLRRMISHHLDGVHYLTEKIRAGMDRKQKRN